MQIIIVGGSGRTGKLVIDEALLRGHSHSSCPQREEPGATQSG